MVLQTAQLISIKGPLGIVWIAAHLDRQLKRNQIIEASITSSVDEIIKTEFPQLRLSSQLLLGVVRIYSRKVGYLYQECNDALVSIRDVSQKPAQGNATTAPGTVPREAITVPILELDDITMNASLPTSNAIPQLDLHMGPSTSMGVGNAADNLFGMQPSGFANDEFEDMDGGIPFDLAIEDFDRLQSEPILPMDTQPTADQGADLGSGDFMNIDIDLNLNLDEMEPMDFDQQPTAAETTKDMPADVEPPRGDGAAAAEPPSADASAQYDMPTQSEPGTQQTDSATQHNEPGTQQTEDDSKAQRGGRRRAAAGEAGPDTPGASRELRSRQKRAAAAASVTEAQNEAGSQAEPAVSQQSTDTRTVRRQAQKGSLYKRPAVVDFDKKEQRIMVQLPGQLQRQLLEDRSPLLTDRGNLVRPVIQQVSALKPHGGPLYKSTLTGMMAEPLQELYRVCMDIMDPDELMHPHPPEKKSKRHHVPEATPTRDAQQATDTAQDTSTAVHIPDAADGQGVPPDTPAHPATAPEPMPQDHPAEDDVVMPTPELARRDDHDVPLMTPGPHDDVDLAPAGEEGPHSVARSSAAAEETPAGKKRAHRQEPEEEEEEEEAEPLPPHIKTDLTGGGTADDEEAENDSVTAKSFTRRTRVVVSALQAAFQHAGGGKTGNKSAGAAIPNLHMSSFVKGHNRLHASRWFFELLVLKSKGVVELQQKRPYGDVAIGTTAKLVEVTSS